MGGITKLAIDVHTLLVIDYSELKENEMKVLIAQLTDVILSENKPQRVLMIFADKNYVTPMFMRHAENEFRQCGHLVERSAFVGLSSIRRMILKGFNFLMKRDFKAFNTKEEAIAYLVE